MVRQRITSILFLLLMVLNTVGYYSFLVITRDNLNSELVDRLQSSTYDPAGDLIIKMPLSMPYSADTYEYQQISGQISFEGSVYSFVKQRMYRDTLYVVCLRDHKVTEATNKVKEFSKSFADEGKQTSSGVKLISSAAKYYCISEYELVSAISGWSLNTSFGDHTSDYHYQRMEMIFHPPQSIS